MPVPSCRLGSQQFPTVCQNQLELGGLSLVMEIILTYSGAKHTYVKRLLHGSKETIMQVKMFL